MEQGHRLGKYEILDVLGQGGNGVVYLAKDTILGKKWAIKQTDKTRFSKTYSNQIEEALVMRELDHPGIPRITEQIEDEDSFYIVMDYCKGESLWQLCNRRKATIDEIIDWGIQLCDILNYLHEQNPPIIFRDVKPGNVICGENNRLKLIDFGIAKTDFYGKMHRNGMFGSCDDAGDNGMTGMKCAPNMYDARGTRGFAAPEQYKGKYSIQSDIYNLGATLLWCMKGSRVVPLQKILKKATAQEAVKRYKNCHLLKKKLLHLQKKRQKEKKRIHIYLIVVFVLISVGISENITGMLRRLDLEHTETLQVLTIEYEMEEENTQAFIKYIKNVDVLLQKQYMEDRQSYIENLEIKKEYLTHILDKLEGGTAVE